MHATNQGWTGHSSNAILVVWAFTISKTKCLKKGLLKEFRGSFGFFCIECRRGLLIRRRGLWIPVRPCYKCLVSPTSCLRNHLLSHNIEMAKRKAPSESSTSTPTTTKKPKISQLSVFYQVCSWRWVFNWKSFAIHEFITIVFSISSYFKIALLTN
jgi:hypothetical protein